MTCDDDPRTPSPAPVGSVETAVVADSPERSRYEIRLGGRLVGWAHYRRRDGVLVADHTEVEPAVGGRGLGTRLVRTMLDDALRSGLAVDPVCPFVAAVVRRHPEYRRYQA